MPFIQFIYCDIIDTAALLLKILSYFLDWPRYCIMHHNACCVCKYVYIYTLYIYAHYIFIYIFVVLSMLLLDSKRRKWSDVSLINAPSKIWFPELEIFPIHAPNDLDLSPLFLWLYILLVIYSLILRLFFS